MLIRYSLLLSVFLSTLAYSQNIVVIDRNEDTESIFNEDNPESLISMIQQNSGYLGYFDPEGITDSVYALYSPEEIKQLARYNRQHGTEPLIDEDPNSPNFGYELIYVEPETGMEYFVYAAPDSVFIDLSDISRLILTYSQGDSSIFGRLERIELVKIINNNFTSVGNFAAKDFMTFDGFSVLTPITDEWHKKLMESENGLWQTMRDTSIFYYNEYKRKVAEDDFISYMTNGVQTIFPSMLSYIMSDGNESPYFVHNAHLQELNFLRGPSIDCYADRLPFTFELGDSLEYGDTNNRQLIHSQFAPLYYLYYQDPTPLMEDDPESEWFGYDKTEVAEDGTVLYFYQSPYPEYFWVEYSPIIYVSTGINYDEENKGTTAKVVNLYFCRENPNGKPSLISMLTVDEKYAHFLGGYPSFPPITMDWYSTFYQELANTKNLYNLNNAKHLKKLKKRNIKYLKVH